jgi:hypothetical protein
MTTANRLNRVLCAALLATLAIAGCTSLKKQREAERVTFLDNVIGEWANDSGAQLIIGGVRVRMITDYAIYVERSDAQGTTGRIVTFEIKDDEEKTIVQRAMVFTEQGRWLNMRQNPELFTALLPQDVKPAGTCKMRMFDDFNSLEYSCSGSAVEIFKRRG